MWVAGELVTAVRDGCVEVMCEGEEGRRVVEVRSPDQLPLLRNPDVLVGANDLTSLSYLHEPAGKTLLISTTKPLTINMHLFFPSFRQSCITCLSGFSAPT